MGCGGRKRELEVRPEAKWDYISLNDFKSSSCFTPFAYGYLYFSLLLSVTVYGVDIFTAVNLLAFNKWSSEIEPTISFQILKWIFSVCIILSAINLVFEHIRAQRTMRGGSVAECYLDNLAMRLESIRMGQGRGWKRFLVFAELTKSKKGAEYIALFTYFGFQSWIRVIVCSGPRQVVNALTLLSVYNTKLSASGSTALLTLESFFDKIEALAHENYQQALILSGMLYTLVIWVFSFLSLLLAVLFYVGFLWSYTSTDDGLSRYCERKINKRLMDIVAKKVHKAIEEEQRQQRRAELKAARRAGEKPPEERQATLPTFMDGGGGGDKLPEMPMAGRNDTMTTLPAYTSRPGTPGSIELSSFDQRRPIPSRAGTSSAAYASRAPLLGAAADPGFGRPESPAPTLPSVDMSNYPPARTATANANNRGYGPPGPLSRVPTDASYGFPRTQTPASYAGSGMPSPSIRSPSTAPTEGYGRPWPPQPSGRSATPLDDYASSAGRSSPAPTLPFSMAGRAASPAPTLPFSMAGRAASPAPSAPPAPYATAGRASPTPPAPAAPYAMAGRSSPAPSMQSGRNGPQPPRTMGPAAGAGPGPGHTMRSATGPMNQPPGPPWAGTAGSGYPPHRSMTAPPQNPFSGGDNDYFGNRSGTPQGPGPRNLGPTVPTTRPGFGNGWNTDVEAQGEPRY